jgi:hypothetical protein
MSIFGLQAHPDHLNLYKIGNSQNHFISHVIKFVVSLLIVRVQYRS